MIDFFSIDLEPSIVDAVYSKCDRVFNTINEVTGGNLDANELWLIFLSEVNVDVKSMTLERLQEFIDGG